MKLVVIGCGGVGSAVARDLADEGWDVTAVDEQEEALTRLGHAGPAASSSATGWTPTSSVRAGVPTRTRRRRRHDGDNTNLVIGQVVEKRWASLRRRPDPRSGRAESTPRAACARLPDADRRSRR